MGTMHYSESPRESGASNMANPREGEVGQIGLLMVEVKCRLQDVHTTLSNLVDRVSPILTPDQASPLKPTPGPTSSSDSKVAEDLEQVLEGLTTLAVRMSNITERVDL